MVYVKHNGHKQKIYVVLQMQGFLLYMSLEKLLWIVEEFFMIMIIIKLIHLINLVIKEKDLPPLTFIGLRRRMRLIRPMRGMSISTMALTVGVLRAMSMMFGVLGEDSDLTFDFKNLA